MINKRRVIKFIKKTLLCIAIIIAAFGMLVAYTNKVTENISKNIVRLHVVAESDLEEDQEIKLKVRDKVLDYMDDKLMNIENGEEGAEIIKKHIPEIERVAEKVVRECGKEYEVKAEYGKFIFPTKRYANINLPAGKYNSLRITLGKGVGQNWWCVLFPPLCFVDSAEGKISEESEQKLKEIVSEDEFKLITEPDDLNEGKSSEDIKINVKFKIVEVIQETKNIIQSALNNLFK